MQLGVLARALGDWLHAFATFMLLHRLFVVKNALDKNFQMDELSKYCYAQYEACSLIGRSLAKDPGLLVI